MGVKISKCYSPYSFYSLSTTFWMFPHKKILIKVTYRDFEILNLNFKKIEIYHCSQWKKMKMERQITCKWLIVQRNGAIWNSMVVVALIWDIFDHCVFKNILSLVSKWPVTRKRLTEEQKGVKFGTRGQLYYVYVVPLTFQSSFWGNSVQLT